MRGRDRGPGGLRVRPGQRAPQERPPPRDDGWQDRSGPPQSVARAGVARQAAVRVLCLVEEGAHAEDELARLAPEDPRERALAWHLTLGSLRRRGQVDAALRACLSQPLGGLDLVVRSVLRIAAFEKLFSRTPPHAVVDQAVEVARALGMGRATSLVNAVLRRVEPVPVDDADRLNHPAWLLQRWRQRYGPAADAWCEANAEPPPLVIGVVDAAAFTAAAGAAGITTRPARAHGVEVPGCLRVERTEGAAWSGRVEELPGFDGSDPALRCWVQDAAAAWMTDLVPADAVTVLDACAAPGGKTFRLAARGAQVTAVDVDPGRLARLEGGAARLHLEVPVVRHDWADGPLPGGGGWDAVLVDAPCTGLGTVRRHPEVRWRRGPMDPLRSAERQRGILRATAPHVRPGGALIYVVCSPEPEEGREVVAAFLRDHPGWTLEETRVTAPPEDDEDAFYGARLRAPG